MQTTRRDFLKLTAGGLILAACTPSVAFASYAAKPRELALSNLHTGESIETRYFNGKNYVRSELKRLNHLCRDFRRDEVHAMDKLLFDQLCQIQLLLGTQAEVHIVSGYRSPATNKQLRSKSKGVAKKSYHMSGQAIDFRLDGVSLKKIREAAISLQAGGVGYYPKSQFIHIDTGPVRQWVGA
ncbi:DUF882 domain-containing protein [Vibrio cholerae]|nr:DUF882 domain-containing protein [Vibrio cholerae]EJL6954013.1 DUF882 domain-containing protein [Vibrio cholerae]ELI0374638.1 DUF882 domain-containing protein [Vibrio cholerae]